MKNEIDEFGRDSCLLPIRFRRWRPQINTDPWLEDDCSDVEAKLAIAVEALVHYADESFWDDTHPDMDYAPATLYNFEDEVEGKIGGNFIAKEALAKIRGEK